MQGTSGYNAGDPPPNPSHSSTQHQPQQHFPQPTHPPDPSEAARVAAWAAYYAGQHQSNNSFPSPSAAKLPSHQYTTHNHPSSAAAPFPIAATTPKDPRLRITSRPPPPP
eukprot:CAMPEP_0194332070 /NCGR_PEP_ID=MMETSP0171-20130528/57910_1 /TAXON_ID=218684 /ORGANISM="Corethron pennatum, Strain L29A3" /LENGTH=109 /DNA_ID=CAMNT_0039093773 /DNA_START=68 /DNA_END=393 /DNA_ORIENTATION=-